ncbi:signal recognition particle-docking protein FtsY [Corynebacterium kroppenstedtii]|uniref:signal recognition particle-docking protein FtsY n=1 Tax=Corynebacterium sp. PCR 32 TaxID=3351342 RepID=UPI0030B7AD30
MSPVVLWTIVGVVVVVVLVALLILLGLHRRKKNTVSFASTADDAEEKQRPDSGNYEAKGGFNFSSGPAAAHKPSQADIVAGDFGQTGRRTVAEPGDRVSVGDTAKAAGEESESLSSTVARREPGGGSEGSDGAGGCKNLEAGAGVVTSDTVAAEEDSAHAQECESDAKDATAPGFSFPVREPDEVVATEDTSDDDAGDDHARTEGGRADEGVNDVRGTGVASADASVAVDAERAAGDDAHDYEVDASVDESVDDGATDSDGEYPEKVAVADVSAPVQGTDAPAPVDGRLHRLRGRLSRSHNAIGKSVLGILGGGDLDEDAWEDIEDTLLMADLGTPATMKVVDALREKIASHGVSSEQEARALLRQALIESCHPELDRSIRAMPYDGKPAVILVVGVNGTGKTTTVGKLARVLTAMGHRVVLGAADTFRAAAADQLEAWGSRVDARTVRGAEGADPASVAFDAVAVGVAEKADVVVVDTAGRLHTENNLMDQLGKVKRVVEKKAVVDEVLLVLDSTVGQNGVMQARIFAETVDITGVVLTKLDGTAKGGIVFQVQEELGVPVKMVGLGEGVDDLAPFEVDGFVDALLG